MHTMGHVIAIIHTTGHVIDNYGEDLIQLNHYINTTGSTIISFPTSRTGKYGNNNQLMHNNYSNNNVNGMNLHLFDHEPYFIARNKLIWVIRDNGSLTDFCIKAKHFCDGFKHALEYQLKKNDSIFLLRIDRWW